MNVEPFMMNANDQDAKDIQDDREEEKNKEDSDGSDTNKIRPLNILLVDDEALTLRILSNILRDKGYNISTARDGYEAVQNVNERNFDLIFMDIKLPGINGVETFKTIKKIRPDISVIMMTGYTFDDLVKEALQEGALSCLYKPVDVSAILNIIENHN